MSKRLVKLRGTEKFRRITNGTGAGATHSPRNVVWSSCGNSASKGGGKAGGSGKAKFTTAYGPSRMANNLRQVGEGLFLLGTGWTASIIFSPIGVPTMVIGMIMGVGAANTEWVKYSKPCSEKLKTGAF